MIRFTTHRMYSFRRFFSSLLAMLAMRIARSYVKQLCLPSSLLSGLLCFVPAYSTMALPLEQMESCERSELPLFFCGLQSRLLTDRGFLPVCCIGLAEHPNPFKKEELVYVVARMRHNIHQFLFVSSVSADDKKKSGKKSLLVRSHPHPLFFCFCRSRDDS